MTPTRRGVLAGTLAALGGCLGTRRRDPVPRCPPDADGDARLGFVGDAMLGRSVNDHWREGPPAGVWGGLADRLRSLDGLFCNLECCLSDRGDPRPGRTYHFRADPDWAVPALEAAGVDFASLANNHVLDFGRGALAATRDHLDAAGIAHAGAGSDAAAALDPAVVECGDLRVGVLALTDRSPSYAAGPASPGTAFAALRCGDPPTRRRVRETLSALRVADPDLVVASLHWGPNWVTRPARGQRAFARWLVERGVDVVHGHSAHVIQGVETHRGRPILYDCGDFVDDYLFKEGLHNKRSFRFELAVSEGVPEALHLSPVQIYDESVHPAGDREAAWLRRRMRSLSTALGTTVERDGRGLSIPLGNC